MTNKTELQKRMVSPELDKILGVKFNVLDDGFIRVVDYMGSDASIVQAARVSYGAGTKQVHEDRGLIRYLMRHHHTTPFEMCEIKLHMRVPMDCWRQWIRHRTASINEYSTRYSEAIDLTQKTPADAWRKQADGNRQGSKDYIDSDMGVFLTTKETEFQDSARQIYKERLHKGVSREQARKDLPLSTYTEAYWKIDLHNLLHFLLLRMDLHAQDEIRSYANVIGNEIVSKWCPIIWEAFNDYKINALYLTKIDQDIIKEITSGNIKEANIIADKHGWLLRDENGLKYVRERDEFEVKLKTVGLPIPWAETIK